MILLLSVDSVDGRGTCSAGRQNRGHRSDLSRRSVVMPPRKSISPQFTKTTFHHVARLVSFDSTGYELSKTSPFARWGGVEVENELNKDVAKSSPKEIFEITFLHNHSSP